MSAPKAKRLAQLITDAKRAGWGQWIRSAADERALLNGAYFDVAAAERVRGFYSDLLVHSKGKFAGDPFTLLDWQYLDVIGPIYGWMRADGSRRYRRAYVEIPKKNGKSTIASGVGLYHLVADREPGAEVYLAAADRDQASIVYNEAANMVEASADLLAILKVRRSTKLILYEDLNSKLEAIAADADSAEGKNASALILDEVHAWRGREFFESLLYSGRAREQPLIFMITTAGDDMTGVCYEEHEKALRIMNGEEFDDRYFGYVRAAGVGDDWKSPATWAKANPSLGVTIKEDEFAADCAEAVGNPRKENAFKRYGLDLWVGASEAWISTEVWGACYEAFQESQLADLDAWGGIDLSRTQDLSALVWIVPVDELYYVVERLFMPKDLIREKEKTDKVPYGAWVEEGFITATDGNVVDYKYIRAAVRRDAELFTVAEIGFDPYNAEYLCNQQLRDEDGLETIAVGQGMPKMGPPSTAFESLLKQRRIRHRNNPCLNTMVGNAVAREDENKNIKPSKRRSRGRIDGLIALLIGLSRALPAEGAGGSYYDDNDLESI